MIRYILKNKYVVKDGDVLVGSSLLKRKDDNSNRVEYMLNHIQNNKVVDFYNEKFPSKNKNNLLKLIQKEYLNYRDNWNNQPANILKNKIPTNTFKDKNIAPLCLDIETAAICDLACPFCFREFTATPDKIIDEKVCYDLIDQAAALKIPSIKFNWRGEPLLHPKLPDFIAYAKKKGILETIINTNATNLKGKLATRLIESGLDFIIYSFDGGTKETYEKMRPGRFKKNTFESTYENIKNFKLLKDSMNSKFPYTKIQMILMKETFNEKKQFFDNFNQYVDDVSLSQYTERGANISDMDEDQLSQYHHELAIHKLPVGTAYLRDALGNIKLATGRKPCEQPFQRLLVTYEGRVAMCCYDWGATYPVGYTNKKALSNLKDYSTIVENAGKSKKGFELLKAVKMPKQFNDPPLLTSSLSDIWYGNEINRVRDKHLINKGEEINICKHCSFKDVYNWIE